MHGASKKVQKSFVKDLCSSSFCLFARALHQMQSGDHNGNAADGDEERMIKTICYNNTKCQPDRIICWVEKADETGEKLSCISNHQSNTD